MVPYIPKVKAKLKSKDAISAVAKKIIENTHHIIPFARLYFFTFVIVSGKTILPAQKCIGVFLTKAQIPIAIKTIPQKIKLAINIPKFCVILLLPFNYPAGMSIYHSVNPQLCPTQSVGVELVAKFLHF
jgi:hypothetical protein